MTTIEMDRAELEWRTQTYRGNVERELTLPALGVGSLMGALLIIGNVYMGLRAGVVVGGSLVAALLSFVVFRALRRTFTPLENNISQTVGSAAGTLGCVWDVLPALVLLGTPLSWRQALVWCLSVSLLGVFFSIPLRRQLVLVEKLPFPDGTACAETIRGLHRQGEQADRRAGLLGLAGTGAASLAFLKDGLGTYLGAAARGASEAVQARVSAFAAAVQIPDRIFPFDFLGRVFRGHASSEVYLGFTTSPMFLAIGLLVGPRVGLSMLLGAFVSWGVIAPWLLDQGVVEALKYKQTVSWTMWVGTALMVSAGLTSLVKNGGLLLSTFRGARQSSGALSSDPARLELSPRAWLAGLLTVSTAVLALLRLEFGIPVWAGLVALLLSFVLAVVATRATGETNNNPVGAVGHVTQGVFSGIGGGGAFPNVLAGGITAAGAQQAADMMQDLKTGHLLGATPRRQFIAQIVGVSVGALVAVPAFFLLKAAYGIGPDSEMLPAPAGISWSNFARVLSEGFDALPPHSVMAVLVAALLGVALTLPPRRIQRWLPSPFALGIAFIYPGMYALTICLGALLGKALCRFAPRFAEGKTFLLAAGLIVGEAVMGTLLAAWMLTSDLVAPWLFLLLPLLLLGTLALLAYYSLRQLRKRDERS